EPEEIGHEGDERADEEGEQEEGDKQDDERDGPPRWAAHARPAAEVREVDVRPVDASQSRPPFPPRPRSRISLEYEVGGRCPPFVGGLRPPAPESAPVAGCPLPRSPQKPRRPPALR